MGYKICNISQLEDACFPLYLFLSQIQHNWLWIEYSGNDFQCLVQNIESPYILDRCATQEIVNSKLHVLMCAGLGWSVQPSKENRLRCLLSEAQPTKPPSLRATKHHRSLFTSFTAVHRHSDSSFVTVVIRYASSKHHHRRIEQLPP